VRGGLQAPGVQVPRSMRDEEAMRDALELAARAKGNTSPNPMVGAIVIAADGSMAGAGYHERAGAAHAEAAALAQAGHRASGATLVVSLEPCHLRGRTPACTDAIIAAGVTRVVIAMLDPDARERGQGVAALRAAGIAVDAGMRDDEAARLNRMYVRHRTTGRPYVTLKMAQSLDGAVALRPQERLQLTGARARAHVRDLRYEHDAVLIGVGTALVDDPQLTVRPYRRRSVPYVRVVADSAARLPLDSRLVKDRSRASTTVAVTGAAPAQRVDALEAAGVRVLRCAQDAQGRIDLGDLLKRLGALDILGLLCEGGPRLAASLLDGSYVDEAQWIVAPAILGSAAAAPVVAGLRAAVHFDVRSVRKLGADVLVAGVPRPPSTGSAGPQ
jgi:diaminohydroxyphosphoribosylaminopyrimidine deaminase/5-amino-6-(5-phosphoribosylamino)uracil reductase